MGKTDLTALSQASQNGEHSRSRPFRDRLLRLTLGMLFLFLFFVLAFAAFKATRCALLDVLHIATPVLKEDITDKTPEINIIAADFITWTAAVLLILLGLVVGNLGRSVNPAALRKMPKYSMDMEANAFLLFLLLPFIVGDLVVLKHCPGIFAEYSSTCSLLTPEQFNHATSMPLAFAGIPIALFLGRKLLSSFVEVVHEALFLLRGKLPKE